MSGGSVRPVPLIAILAQVGHSEIVSQISHKVLVFVAYANRDRQGKRFDEGPATGCGGLTLIADCIIATCAP